MGGTLHKLSFQNKLGLAYSILHIAVWIIRLRFKKKELSKMGFSKVIESGKLGSVTVSEEAGVVSLVGSLDSSVGGGEATGIVTIGASVSVKMSAKQMIDIGLELAATKFPSVASEIALAKAAIDAELAKA